ncbi:MAG: riboflavin biosynthesis protein RibF [Armatimonadota bacterium]|nr:riboflavin biosynthesis protein RibF [Armatimonadota bacterium]
MQTVFGLDAITTKWPPSTACVGVFDGVHLGHAAIIREAVSRARLAGRPAVALTFDRHPMAVLAPQNCPKSILAPHANLRKMEAMGLDVVVVATFDRPFSQLTASDFYRGVLLEKLNTAEMVVGHDFAFGHKRVGTAEWLAEQMPTHIHPPLEMDGVRISSSAVRKAIDDGRVADAGRLLGGSFCLEGVVVRGQRLGSRLGVPTANLSPLFNQVLPGAGIYAGRAEVRGNRYSCAISVGFRPTVSTAGFAVEAHLMDFKDGDLYGHSISLEFVERLRDEVAFESTSALTDQMHVDIENARKVLIHHG